MIELDREGMIFFTDMTHGNTTLASKHIAVFTVDKFEEERYFLGPNPERNRI